MSAVASMMALTGTLTGEFVPTVPSLDLYFSQQAISYARTGTSATSPKANGDQPATTLITQGKTSGANAYYLGPNGDLIRSSVSNLVPHATTFTTGAGWDIASVGVTSGQTDPFGGTAASVLKDNNNSFLQIRKIHSGNNKVYCASVFIKKQSGTTTNLKCLLRIRHGSSGSFSYSDLQIDPETGNYNLENNHSTNQPELLKSYREDFGDWWRFSIASGGSTSSYTYTESALEFFPAVATAFGSSNYTPSSQGNVTVFGFQFESDVATPSQYVAPGANSHVARIEYDSSGNALGLLTEDTRTNELVRTNQFNNTNWTKNSYSISQDTSVYDPTGRKDAWKLSQVAANQNYNNQALMYQQPAATFAVGDFAVFSVFARPISGGTNELILTANSEKYCSFNLSNGTVAYDGTGTTQNDVASIKQCGGGWYRCSVLYEINNVNSANRETFYIIPGDGSFAPGSHSYLHQGTEVCHIYGAQVEKGKILTSYIHAWAGIQTRDKDECYISAGNWFNATEMSVAFEVSGLQQDYFETQRVISLNNNSSPQNNRSDYHLNTTNGIQNYAVDNAVPFRSAGATITPADFAVAARIEAGNYNHAGNGTLANADTITVVDTVPTFDRIFFGHGPSNNKQMCGHIKRFRYWPRTTSNAGLRALSENS